MTLAHQHKHTNMITADSVHVLQLKQSYMADHDACVSAETERNIINWLIVCMSCCCDDWMHTLVHKHKQTRMITADCMHVLQLKQSCIADHDACISPTTEQYQKLICCGYVYDAVPVSCALSRTNVNTQE